MTQTFPSVPQVCQAGKLSSRRTVLMKRVGGGRNA